MTVEEQELRDAPAATNEALREIHDANRYGSPCVPQCGIDALVEANDALLAAAEGEPRQPRPLDDLAERLTKKRDALAAMADDAWCDDEERRLNGKAEGVALALSFVDEYRRAPSGEVDTPRSPKGSNQ